MISGTSRPPLSNFELPTLRGSSKLLLSHGFDRRHSFPFNVSKDRILNMYRRKRIYDERFLEVPSFRLIYEALQRGLTETAIERVMHPKSSKYGYWGSKPSLKKTRNDSW